MGLCFIMLLLLFYSIRSVYDTLFLCKAAPLVTRAAASYISCIYHLSRSISPLVLDLTSCCFVQ